MKTNWKSQALSLSLRHSTPRRWKNGWQLQQRYANPFPLSFRPRPAKPAGDGKRGEYRGGNATLAVSHSSTDAGSVENCETIHAHHLPQHNKFLLGQVKQSY